LKNVREAIERLFERHLPVITEALKPADPDPTTMADASSRDEPAPATSTEPVRQESLPAPTPASPRQEAALAKRQRRVGRFERVHELRRQGMPIRQIARELDMSRKSVRRYLRRERCPDWRPGRATRSGMDAHREWIDARIAEGRINASEIHAELGTKGVRLSYATVRRYITKRLGRAGKARPRVNAARPKPTPPPSPKQLSFDWIRRPEKRSSKPGAAWTRSEGPAPI
jgi:transposase